MLERSIKVAAVLFVAATMLDGCAYFSKSGRQQLAYEKYVRKCSKLRDRRAAKMRPASVPTAEVSAPREVTQVGAAPESVASSAEPQPAADARPSAEVSP